MARLEQIELAQLEGLIDRHSLAGVLEALAAICSEKRDHLRISQDTVEAAKWFWASMEIGSAQCYAAKNGI